MKRERERERDFGEKRKTSDQTEIFSITDDESGDDDDGVRGGGGDVCGISSSSEACSDD